MVVFCLWLSCSLCTSSPWCSCNGLFFCLGDTYVNHFRSFRSCISDLLLSWSFHWEAAVQFLQGVRRQRSIVCPFSMELVLSDKSYEILEERCTLRCWQPVCWCKLWQCGSKSTWHAQSFHGGPEALASGIYARKSNTQHFRTGNLMPAAWDKEEKVVHPMLALIFYVELRGSLRCSQQLLICYRAALCGRPLWRQETGLLVIWKHFRCLLTDVWSEYSMRAVDLRPLSVKHLWALAPLFASRVCLECFWDCFVWPKVTAIMLYWCEGR